MPQIIDDALDLILSPVGACVVLLALVVLFMAMAGTQESDACKAKGGHIVSKSNVGFTSNGGTAVTTVSFCLSADGRILEVN